MILINIAAVLLPAQLTALPGGTGGDTIPLYSGDTIRKSIYSQQIPKRNGLYNYLWGKHYRQLYSTPITVTSSTLRSLLDNMTVTGQAIGFYGLYMADRKGRNYLVKPLSGTSSFVKSEFFREMYIRDDFRDTYLDGFIGDAFTIINPYTFIASDYMAKMAGLNSNNPRLYYIAPHATTDTIIDGTSLQDKLVSIVDVPGLDARKDIISTAELLKKMQADKSCMTDAEIYIRERLFDMLIGDWNKTPENWNWLAIKNGNCTAYQPIVIDRSHAFTKVDGLMTGQMLSVLSLGFITDYRDNISNIKKFNKLGFTLDVALTGQSKRSDWLAQARYLKSALTDAVIDEAFLHLPKEIQSRETNLIKGKLKKRRDNLENMALRYYKDLQFNPVITGTTGNDRFVVDKFHRDSIRIEVYNKDTGRKVFSHSYTRRNSKEIWLYGMDGDDRFEVQGLPKNKIPLYFLGGKGNNTYDITAGSNIKLFGYSGQRQALKAEKDAKVIITDNDRIHRYDYQKTRYKSISFSPWGVYDTDWGLSLGSFVTYTRYGLKRSPFSYQHRIGYNYLKGFMYKGIFPWYDERKSIYIDAFVGSPANFSNFFGYGNNTSGFKDEKKDYNRVKVAQYSVAPSFHYAFKKGHQLIFSSSFELFKIREVQDRYINLYFGNTPSIFDTKYYLDLSVSHETDKKISDFVPVFTSAVTTGWKINLAEPGRNYPYAEAELSFNFRFTDRITLATKMNGRALFNNKYEFYQSASTELRGYRDSRFIGRQSYYQSNDLRIDMGKVKNPFTPLKYGLFGGFDFGRVWQPGESSKKWHVSYGGGAWVTIINKITTKYSWFGSGDDFRFMFGLGLGF